MIDQKTKRIGEEAFSEEFSRFVSLSQVRPVRSIRQWCEDELVVTDGPHPGQFRVSNQPVIGLWFDEIDSGKWVEHYFTGPSQWGKTLIAFIAPALYYTCELAQKYVLGVPDMKMGQDKWEIDLKPALEAAPGLRWLIPKIGQGSRGGGITNSVTLTNGGALKWMTAGGDDSNKAGYTAKVLGVTEAARFSQGTESSVEADPLSQLTTRLRAHSKVNQRIFVEGTTTIKLELPWRARALSTKSQIMVPCSKCGKWISPEREHIGGYEEAENEIEAGENSFWFCYQCGEVLSEDNRQSMIRNARLVHDGQSVNEHGEVVGDLPKSRRLFFRVTPFLNAFLKTSDLGEELWRGEQIDEDSAEKQNEEKRQCQFVFCVPYEPPDVDYQEIDKDQLERRTLAGHPRGVVPDDAINLVVTTDVGEKDGWWVCVAQRQNGQKHVVDYDKFDIESYRLPLKDAIVLALRELYKSFRDGWRKADGTIYKLNCWWVDKNYCPEAVERFAREVKEKTGLRRWLIPATGVGESKFKSRKYIAPRRTGNQIRQLDPFGTWHLLWVRRAQVYSIEWDSDSGKSRVIKSLVIPVSSNGATTLFVAPQKSHKKLVQHVSNERLEWKDDPIRGRIQFWRRTGANHLLDCLAMADTAIRRQVFVDEQTRKLEEEQAREDATSVYELESDNGADDSDE